MNNLNSLQYLRVLAIFVVFFLHTEYLYIIGHFGVDIFFVISGYVMAMIASKGTEPSHFIKDRIFRIAPLYWLATLLTFILAIFFADKMQRSTTNLDHLIYSLLFIPFYRMPNDPSPLFGIGWTLMYEMQFYMIMFFSLLYTKYITRKVSPVLLCFILVGFLTYVCSLFPRDNAIVQFIGSQNPYIFLFGIIAYWLNNHPKFAAFSVPLSLNVALLLVAIILCGYGEKNFMKYRALSIGLPAFFVVLFATRIEFNSGFSLPKQLQATLLLLAEISFSFYITHIFVIMGMNTMLAKDYPQLSTKVFVGFSIALIASLIVAYFTHILLDKPLNRWLRANFNTKPSKHVPLGQS